MPARNKKLDKYVQQILEVLGSQYTSNHPKAKIDVYRYNPGCIRVRIIDPDFAKKDLVEREDLVWSILENSLPEEVLAEISVLLLITPKESKTSFMNMEFEDPAPSPPPLPL